MKGRCGGWCCASVKTCINAPAVLADREIIGTGRIEVVERLRGQCPHLFQPFLQPVGNHGCCYAALSGGIEHGQKGPLKFLLPPSGAALLLVPSPARFSQLWLLIRQRLDGLPEQRPKVGSDERCRTARLVFPPSRGLSAGGGISARIRFLLDLAPMRCSAPLPPRAAPMRRPSRPWRR